MSLFQLGHFQLHSGNYSDWKIDCDFLTDEDLMALAKIAADEILPEFGRVISIPTGGDRLATFLDVYSSSESHITVIVDDVLTTGKSMEEALFNYDGDPDSVVGLVIFNRSGGDALDWIYPIFHYSFAGFR